jgi:hypothetical protein
MIKAGQQFGRWEVIGQAGRSSNRIAMVVCRCECGAIRCLRADNLTSGSTKSCRCYQRDLVAAMNRAHTKTSASISPV